MDRLSFRIALLLLAALALAGCSSQANGGPAKAVEDYLKAVTSKNIDQAVALSCAGWEEQAQMEVDSFGAVAAKIEGLSCEETGREGSSATVACKGKIIATYNNENQEIPLEGRTYQVTQDGSEWRMCGYQ